MTNMTLAIPEDLYKLIRKYNQIKWSEIARQAMWNEAKKLDLLNKLLANSELTEKDAERIGNKIKKEIARKHGISVK